MLNRAATPSNPVRAAGALRALESSVSVVVATSVLPAPQVAGATTPLTELSALS